MSYKKIFLRHGRDISIKRKHHWIFSGGIEKLEPHIENGEIVEIHSADKQYLATGYFCKDASIAIKILSYERRQIDTSFWQELLERAWCYRQSLSISAADQTNSFRLVNAEGDSAPGLIIDIYNTTAVIQSHSLGIEKQAPQISAALTTVLGQKLNTIYFRTEDKEKNKFLKGEVSEIVILEHGLKFLVDVVSGQKTGFFLDQRENRKLVGQYAVGRNVLNAFCYTGGFSLYALKANARKVVSVDSSKSAMEALDKNVALNSNLSSPHQSVVADYLRYMQDTEEEFDLIILDPPAFVKNKRNIDNGLKGYRSINSNAIKRIASGGFLFTFSCSQLVLFEDFKKVILQSALEADRKVRIVTALHQAPCHPVNIYHPETDYLKGLLLYVD